MIYGVVRGTVVIVETDGVDVFDCLATANPKKIPAVIATISVIVITIRVVFLLTCLLEDVDKVEGTVFSTSLNLDSMGFGFPFQFNLYFPFFQIAEKPI